MAVNTLTPAQQSAVNTLVAARRIEQVPPDSTQAAAVLAGAADRISQLPRLTSAGVKYDVAYDAAHDVGEAFLAAYGYRTTTGVGQHEALGRFLRAVIDTSPGDGATRRYDRLRRALNQNRYQATPVGAAEAELAEGTAAELFAVARLRRVGSKARDDERGLGNAMYLVGR